MGLGFSGMFMMYTPELSSSLCKRELKTDYGNANNTMMMMLLLLSQRFLPLLVFVVVVVVSVVALLYLLAQKDLDYQHQFKFNLRETKIFTNSSK